MVPVVKYPPQNIPHNITPPPPAWTVDTWIHVLLFMPNSNSTIQMLQQKSRLIRSGDLFFYLLLFNFGEPVWIVALVLCTSWHPVCSSTAVAHLLLGLMCFAFRDALLHASVVMSFSYCCLSISSNQAGHSPLTSGINKAFSPTELPLADYYLFFRPFSVNPRDGCLWKCPYISTF